MNTLIIRNGQVEHVWACVVMNNGFESIVFVRGTEDEMFDYAKTEIRNWKSYHALLEQETDMIVKMHMKIYCAPKLSESERTDEQ